MSGRRHPGSHARQVASRLASRRMERLRRRWWVVPVAAVVMFTVGSMLPRSFLNVAETLAKSEIDVDLSGVSRAFGGVLAIGAAVGLLRPPRAERAWAKGARGEELVGRRLERLSPDGATVLHDVTVPGLVGNIDHLVVTRAGVFIVETKSLDGRLEVRRGTLRVAGQDRTSILDQVVRQRKVIATRLADAGLGEARLTSVICFVGTEIPWWSPKLLRGSVLSTPRALERTIRAARNRLSDDEYARLVDAVSAKVLAASTASVSAPPATVCPRCGSGLVRRVRRRDGVAFYGCASFPRCRYTRPV
jgi:hypothetical protein